MFDDIPEIVISPDDYDWSTFDRDEFKAWLEAEAPGVYPQYVDLWLRAVEHRYAWKSGRAHSWESPRDLVCHYWDIFGPYAWIDKRGNIFPATYASHDRVCEIIIGADPVDVEKTHARMSQHLRSCEEAWQYVHRPSRKMQQAVYEYVAQHPKQFPFLREI